MIRPAIKRSIFLLVHQKESKTRAVVELLTDSRHTKISLRHNAGHFICLHVKETQIGGLSDLTRQARPRLYRYLATVTCNTNPPTKEEFCLSRNTD